MAGNGGMLLLVKGRKPRAICYLCRELHPPSRCTDRRLREIIRDEFATRGAVTSAPEFVEMIRQAKKAIGR